MADEVQKTTAQQVQENLANCAAALAERFNTLDPNDSAYPLGVVVVGSPRDDAASVVLYQTTALCNAPGHKDGWAQAMVVTRDILLLCNRMNDDFGLGLNLLPAVIAQHPMMQKYFRDAAAVAAAAVPKGPAEPAVTRNADGTRTVTDLGESTAGMEGGAASGPTKH